MKDSLPGYQHPREALEELTRQGTGSRLVAVISHMWANGEELRQRRRGYPDLRGSQARCWASAVERAQLVAGELEAGLLT